MRFTTEFNVSGRSGREGPATGEVVAVAVGAEVVDGTGGIEVAGLDEFDNAGP